MSTKNDFSNDLNPFFPDNKGGDIVDKEVANARKVNPSVNTDDIYLAGHAGTPKFHKHVNSIVDKEMKEKRKERKQEIYKKYGVMYLDVYDKKNELEKER